MSAAGKKPHHTQRGKKKKAAGERSSDSFSIPAQKGDNRAELLFGRQTVLEALKAGLPLLSIYLQESASGEIIKEIRARAKEANIPFHTAGKEELEKTVPAQKHQGVMAFVAPFRYSTVAEILDNKRFPEEPFFLLVLDHLQDPHNVGSLLRTASLSGVDGVVIPKDRACGITPAAYKASAGALAYIPVAQVVNLAREIDNMKEQGLWIMGADAEGTTPFYEAPLEVPLALVLGSEGKGLSRLVKEKCDFLLQIPTRSTISSLNVAVAGGLITYEVYRHRLNIKR